MTGTSSRRDFFKDAGALIVGFSMTAGRLSAQNPTNPTGLVDATQVDSWITIGADESITAYSGKIEFGQGFSTVQTQLVAEELSVPVTRVNVVFGDTGITPDQGYTAGSQSTPTEFGPGGLRQALDNRSRRIIPTGVAATRCSDKPAHRSGRRVLRHRWGSIEPGELRSVAPRQAVQSHAKRGDRAQGSAELYRPRNLCAAHRSSN